MSEDERVSGTCCRKRTKRRLIGCLRVAKQQLQAEIQLGRPWRFETIVMAVFLEHEKKVGEMVKILGELAADKR
jgi:hypothetical protein